jgi:hypothetical protein
MGQVQSEVPPHISILLGLSKTDLRNDSQFWRTFLSFPPSRTTIPSCTAHFFRGSFAFPHNIVNLSFLCIHYVHSASIHGHFDPNSLSWAVQLFTTICQLSISRPPLFPFLQRLDTSVSDTFFPINPNTNGTKRIQHYHS